MGFFPRLAAPGPPPQARWHAPPPTRRAASLDDQTLSQTACNCGALLSSPLQYLGEKAVFAHGRYNAMLTAAEFVSLDLLHRYWGDRYAAGGACGCVADAGGQWGRQAGHCTTGLSKHACKDAACDGSI